MFLLNSLYLKQDIQTKITKIVENNKVKDKTYLYLWGIFEAVKAF